MHALPPRFGEQSGPLAPHSRFIHLVHTEPGGGSFQNDRNRCDFFFLKHLSYVINLGFVEMLFKRL